jgi:hypothetical protein
MVGDRKSSGFFSATQNNASIRIRAGDFLLGGFRPISVLLDGHQPAEADARTSTAPTAFRLQGNG